MGRCSINSLKFCQPSTQAASACRAQTEPDFWAGCNECDGGDGACIPVSPTAVTTVWEWLAALNAARFAGHDDWRLPTINSRDRDTAQPEELRTLLRCREGSCGDGTGACVSPVLGPTAEAYWSATTYAPPGLYGWLGYFHGLPGECGFGSSIQLKTEAHSVRAVRTAR
jgi:hypothetical protein